LQDSGFYQRHRIERRFGTVTRIEPHARTILFDDGASLAYDEA
jgi:phage baseplate assembly protein gpV